MFKKLLQFEVFYQLKQRAFPLLAILFLALGIFVGRQGYAPKGVDFNAVFQIYFHTGIFTLGSVFVIMFFAISAMLRDKQHQMSGLVFSTSIKKAHYFWSRFLGTFLFSVLAFTPFLVGYVFGNYFSDLEPTRLANFELMRYLQPWLYMVVPNIFICTAMIFSVSTLTKNSTATYVSAVFIYMLYFVSSIFLNSPLMAQAVPASPESMAMAAIADPFGIAAFFEQTQFWTPYQKNTQLLSLSGLFLWNRLIWLLISIGVLTTTYGVFSFRKTNERIKKQSKPTKEVLQVFHYKPTLIVHNIQVQLKAFFSMLKLDLRSIFKSLPFIAVILMWLFVVFSELYASFINGGDYGVPVYPFTNQLMEGIVAPLSLLSYILIIFYSAEIVWKERTVNFNLIIDATPVKNAVFFLSKFAAVALLPMVLITTGIAMCIIFQLALGHTNIELNVYASVYYYYGTPLLVYCMIAFFIQALVRNKYMGMGTVGLLLVAATKADVLGLEHPLTSIGFIPRVMYSNMSGFYKGAALFNHLALYWMAFGVLISLVSFKLWTRGVVGQFSATIKQLLNPWTGLQKIAMTLAITVFIAAGSLVFYSMNVTNTYTTIEDRLDFREGYERKYKKYENLEGLYVSARKTAVDLFPSERTYAVAANYILKNKSNEPLTTLFITERIALTSIDIENATMVEHDSIYGTYLFQFATPLQPKDSLRYTYTLAKKLTTYEEDKTIVHNGSYIGHRDFEPIIGYNSGWEINNNQVRKQRNLPMKEIESTTASHITMEEVKFEKIRFETVVSTEKNQTALSTGSLINKWTSRDRNYYHFKAKQPILPAVSYFSAAYLTKESTHKGIHITQYYDAKHAVNIDRIEKSIKETLDYCQDNFGSYAFDHLRIAEIPSHWSFGGFAHPGVISMVEDNLYLTDVSKETTFDLVAKRTIHEVAHQWWGHTLSAKPVAGGALFVEGFAKYSEAVILEKMYGKSALYTLSENARSRYFTGRSFAGVQEPPLYKVAGQNYIAYGKALTILLGLRDLIGEKELNNTLKKITDKHRTSQKLEANSLELLNEIYLATPHKYHALVNDWFKKRVTYNIGIENASYKALENGTFEVVVQVTTKRFDTKDNGEMKEIPIDEPIKIGVFSTHPSKVTKDTGILYYKSTQFNATTTEVRMVVSEVPTHIAIDPYGTRLDKNLVDNLFRL